MGNNTGISWTNHTVNFWHGCLKVSPGCKYCYMYREQKRYNKDPEQIRAVKESTINQILKFAQPGERIFTNSFSDFFFDSGLCHDIRVKFAWPTIRSRKDLIWQLLTKRMDKVKDNLPCDWEMNKGWDNVQLGFSAENQDMLILRFYQWLDSGATDKVWISAEPLLGPLDFSTIFPTKGNPAPNPISWVVLGGESGNDNGLWKYRPCELEWLKDAIRQCKEAGVPVFVKQLGTYQAKKLGISRHGANIEEWPVELQVQEFPK